jgi:hypothetical protein
MTVRRVFHIDVGNIPHQKVMDTLRELKKRNRRKIQLKAQERDRKKYHPVKQIINKIFRSRNSNDD